MGQSLVDARGSSCEHTDGPVLDFDLLYDFLGRSMFPIVYPVRAEMRDVTFARCLGGA